MRQLTSVDAQFVAAEDGCVHGHVTGLAVYDPAGSPSGRLTREDVCGIVAARIHLVEPFRRRLVTVPLGLDLPYWVEDPDFDLDFHVREIALPPPGSREQLAEQVARIHGRPLDRSRPLWELYVVSGLEDGAVAFYTKTHHAAIDGVSGTELMHAL